MPENDTPRAARYPLLTPSQAAERLGVSTRTMQRMLAEGFILHVWGQLSNLVKNGIQQGGSLRAKHLLDLAF